jgi:beta-N-acetylhexosaminidase
MSPLPLHRRIGRLAIVGCAGTSVSPDLKALARDFDLGGVILFARNVEAPGQVAEMAREIRDLARDLPPWVSVDQEGGRVARLRRPFTEWPAMATLGRSGDDALAGRFARALAREMLAVGISLDYAPVLDLRTNPANTVIGDRALGDRPEVVARLGAAIIRALQEEGLAACGKHFPGHGDTRGDSHDTLPVVDHPPERLRAVELVPFRAAIEAGVSSIMSAHVLVPAIDDAQPSTLSPAIMEGLLRTELGFEGVILSDDLQMRAIADGYTVEQSMVGAVAAGCDAVLICGPDHDVHARAFEALVHAVEAEQVPRGRIEDALRRQRRQKERFLAADSPRALRRAPDDVLGCDAHQAIAAEMARFQS